MNIFTVSGESLGSFFAKTPLPWAGLQVAIAFIALMCTFSRRSGPVRMPATDSRLSPLEFVETLGDLYSNAHAAPAAVGVAYQRLRSSLLAFQAFGFMPLLKTKTLPDITSRAKAALIDSTGPKRRCSIRWKPASERAMRAFSVDEKSGIRASFRNCISATQPILNFFANRQQGDPHGNDGNRSGFSCPQGIRESNRGPGEGRLRAIARRSAGAGPRA